MPESILCQRTRDGLAVLTPIEHGREYLVSVGLENEIEEMNRNYSFYPFWLRCVGCSVYDDYHPVLIYCAVPFPD